jgi:hypothetical protein
MPLTSFLLNLLWIAFGGLWMALGWVIAAVLMAITIIGLPWARAAFNIALYTLLPFGQTARARRYTGRGDLSTGALGATEFDLAGAGGLVAGAQPSSRRRCHHDYRDSLRLGAPEARGHSALADRQDDRADRRSSISEMSGIAETPSCPAANLIEDEKPIC